MRTDGTLPKEGDDTINQDDFDNSSSDVEMIEDPPGQVAHDPHTIEISDDDVECDEDFVIDRSLDATKFNLATGFKASKWPELIQTMYQYK